MGSIYTAEEKLWKDKDGNLVKDGDEAAAILFCTPGTQIPYDEAVELGLVKKKKDKPKDKQAKKKKNKKG